MLTENLMKKLDWPRWNRRRDPELYDYYTKHMPEPGWAGHLNDAESEYLRDKLLKSRRLRAKWGFGDEDEALTPQTIQAVALWGLPDDKTHNAWLVHSALSRQKRKRNAA